MNAQQKIVFLEWFKKNEFYLLEMPFESYKGNDIYHKENYLYEKFNKEINMFLDEDHFTTVIKKNEEEIDDWNNYVINKTFEIYMHNEYILLSKTRIKFKGKLKNFINISGNRINSLESIDIKLKELYD